MVFRESLLAFAVLLAASSALAQPPAEGLPEAPEGYRWVLNDAFSDEFDGDALDESKWLDHNPRWQGRPPGRFMPSSVSVAEGCLRIRTSALPEPLEDGKWTIACGAVQSKSNEAYYGYYECRMKASSSRTSSTFWLMSRDRKPCEYGSLSTELDICEVIGGATRWPSFRTRAHYNTHIGLKPNARGEAMLAERLRKNPLTEKELDQLAAIADPDERAKKRKQFEHKRRNLRRGGTSPLRSPADEEFHTYGCWWVSANEMRFYADGEEIGVVRPETDFHPHPYDHKLHMNLICETYDWEVLPSEEQLSDPALGTTLYDYVRSYTLEPVE